MKNLTLTLSVLLMLNGLFASEIIDKKATVIVKLEYLSVMENVEIYDLFKHDSKIHVVNSCQQLGIIVFENNEGNKISALEIEAYLKLKLERVSKKAVVFLKEMTKDQVNQDCRQEVGKIHNSNK